MNTPHLLKYRLIAIGLFLGLVVTLYVGVMYNTQIVRGDEFRAKSLSSNAAAETVEASRGIITDRNGKVLVSNRLTYTLLFSDESFSGNEDLNAAIWRLIELCRANGVSWNDTLPLTRETPPELAPELMDSSFRLFVENQELPAHLDDPDTEEDEFAFHMGAQELLDALCQLYGLTDGYTPEQQRCIAGVRYELSIRKLLDRNYVFADDVSVDLISQVVDGHYDGVSTGTSSARVYNTPYAAHILGRIGPIYKEEWDGDKDKGIEGYKDKGYSMNALVGKDGVERAFEEYLHGSNGTKLVTTNSDGHITGELYVNKPKPGNTVALTLDIDLQEAAEKSLASHIQAIHDRNGKARGGAAVVIGVDSGEVLAMASYPTYDLSHFDELYSQLVKDEVNTPLLNRATDGIYAPGSTFKPLTAVAALESGIIDPSTSILDRGIYTYYSSPQPRCWIYSQRGGTHGYVNVSEAITVSCNYFFYEVGRLTGIDILDSYADQFGLGRSTGIEIGDSSGVMASPEYAEKVGLEWTDGQTITAAIGQSYSLFSPLQLANYIATLVGNGNHYQAHLLKNVKTYDNASLMYAYDKEPENVVEMSDSTVTSVKKGMRDMAMGSMSYIFSKCPVDLGAKTGTAEIDGDGTVNGVFVAFAPYDNPEIAVAVAIERADAGADLAPVAADIINAYFSHREAPTVTIGENALMP